MKHMRVPFAFDVDANSNVGCVEDFGLTKTQQHQKDDADINVIVKRFGLTGQLPQNVRAPMYGDFEGVTDYQSAMHAVMAAQASFMEFPADVRMRFANDPARFVDFCSDPANLEEMRTLGLAVPKAAGTPPSSGVQGA